MRGYHDLLEHVLEHGERRENRTGVDTIGVFGTQNKFDLREGFPAMTTKKLAWRAVVGELLWFMEGSTDERRLAEITFEKTRFDLHDRRTIWTDNADHQGKALGHFQSPIYKELGPIYGKQWRDFNGVDQLAQLIDDINSNPYSRRHILTAWNPSQLNMMALPPCHVLSQFYVNNAGELSCQLYQRSCDLFLGAPFNIASYALLTHIIARLTNTTPGILIYTLGDAHIYANHLEAVEEQLSREPRPLPALVMPEFKTLNDVLACRVSDFKLENYNPYPTIKAEMAV